MFVSFCELSSKSIRTLVDSPSVSCKCKDSFVYIGSDFCYRKLHSIESGHVREIRDSVHALDGKLFFVFPIVPERELAHFHEFVSFLSEIGIDGIVANDYGAMHYIHGHYPDIPLSIGRLLVKNSRDYSSKGNAGCRFPAEVELVAKQFDIRQIHLDSGGQTALTNQVATLTHEYKYISSSMRCEHKRNARFDCYTVDGKCGFDCLHQYVRIGPHGVIRIGNTILCHNDEGSPSIEDLGIDTLIKTPQP